MRANWILAVVGGVDLGVYMLGENLPEVVCGYEEELWDANLNFEGLETKFRRLQRARDSACPDLP